MQEPRQEQTREPEREPAQEPEREPEREPAQEPARAAVQAAARARAQGPDKTEQLGTAPMGRLFVSLAAPAVAAQVINLLYNLVDRMYIGHMEGVGRLALTGVGVCLPLIMIISAFAALGGMGGAPRASICLGRGDREGAEKILGNCFSLLLVFSVVLTAVFLLLSEPMLLLFGASENSIGYAMEYMEIYALGTLFVQMTLGLNAFISAQGFTTMSMLTVLIGAVTNIVLDPVFIFALDMGVRGAALATVLSQGLSMAWTLWFLTGKQTNLHLRRRQMKLEAAVVLPCVGLGLSPFIMQSTESLIAVCFNASLLEYGGDLAVGTMTILTSLMQFSLMPLMGLTQGAQPIISYNYGARNAQRVKRAFLLLLAVCAGYSTLLWGAVQLFPEAFVRIFNDDPELVAYGARAARLYMLVNCVFGVQVACQQTFVALGNARSSLFLALLRKVLLLIPLIYVLPAVLPSLLPVDRATAVFAAEPVADLLAVAVTVTLFAIQLRRALAAMERPA